MSFHQDLDNLTRDMHDASWEVEYMRKNPVTALMLERKSLQFKGGKQYYREVDTDTMEDIVQDYQVNETLTHQVKNTTERVTFRRKKFQAPIQVDEDEELENESQTPDKTRLHNLSELRVKKVQEAVRLHIRKLMYRGTGHSLAATDTNKYMQGLNSALTVDATYGQITRSKSAGTNDWFQPMDNQYDATGGASGDQNGEYTLSIHWLRSVLEPMEDLESDNVDLVTIVGGVLWLALIEEAEARGTPYKIVPSRLNKGGGTTTQGFEEMIIDRRRVIKDPFLKTGNNTTMGETAGTAGALERRLYCLNLKDWDMFIHPKRDFKLTEFFDQSQLANGSDFSLARIKFGGNLVCWHPNRQLYLSNVVP